MFPFFSKMENLIGHKQNIKPSYLDGSLFLRDPSESGSDEESDKSDDDKNDTSVSTNCSFTDLMNATSEQIEWAVRECEATSSNSHVILSDFNL